MPQFFDPHARVTFFTETKPLGTVAITPQPWELFGDDDIPQARPPLRRQNSPHNMQKFPKEKEIVHVSVLTGEHHTRGDIEEVHNEQGMKRVIAENVRPQRPLDANAYRAFALEVRHASYRLFQRQATKATIEATDLDKDTSSIIATYMTQP